MSSTSQSQQTEYSLTLEELIDDPTDMGRDDYVPATDGQILCYYCREQMSDTIADGEYVCPDCQSITHLTVSDHAQGRWDSRTTPELDEDDSALNGFSRGIPIGAYEVDELDCDEARFDEESGMLLLRKDYTIVTTFPLDGGEPEIVHAIQAAVALGGIDPNELRASDTRSGP